MKRPVILPLIIALFVTVPAGLAAAQTFNLDGTRADQPQQSKQTKANKSKPAKAAGKAKSSGPVAVDQSPNVNASVDRSGMQSVNPPAEKAAKTSAKAENRREHASENAMSASSGKAAKPGKKSGKKSALAKKTQPKAPAPAPEMQEAAVPPPPPAPVVNIPSAADRFAHSQPPSPQLQQQIQSALHEAPELHALNVNVTDEGIDLSGSVDNSKDKLAAQRIVQSFAGNRRVHETLTVLNPTPAEQAQAAARESAQNSSTAAAADTQATTSPTSDRAAARAARREARRKAAEAQKSFTGQTQATPH